MVVGIPKEPAPENRTPLVPETVKKLSELGARLTVERGTGAASGYADEDYEKAGASMATDRVGLLSQADAVLRLNRPPLQEIQSLKPGCVHISFLDPFGSKELVLELARRGIQAVSMELVPRISRAQKMDALSSQASLAGYVAVILASERLPRIFPMMMTPAGTLSPARVFVIGAGVAGLQAIATARRLGARVEAFDPRPGVQEEIQSLGAKFVKADLGEVGQTESGYAEALNEKQLAKQREVTARHCALADVVITTAQVFGGEAPRIVTRQMVEAMRPGSVVVDLAVEAGGNVEGSEKDREIVIDGVRVLGYTQLAARVPTHASQMYSNNLGAMFEEWWDENRGELSLVAEDEIVRGCLVTRDGSVCHPMLRGFYEL
jgi:NAD(P) transhydrogenase subunit alpha